jgi:hypothetical protein
MGRSLYRYFKLVFSNEIFNLLQWNVYSHYNVEVSGQRNSTQWLYWGLMYEIMDSEFITPCFPCLLYLWEKNCYIKS